MQHEVLGPVGFHDTSVDWPADDFALPYILACRGRRDFLASEGVIDAMVDDRYTDGSVFAPASDVALFFEALTTGRLLAGPT